jgi:hypothetical protein
VTSPIEKTSGPAMSGTSPAGASCTSSTSRAATSRESTGCNRRPPGFGTTGDFAMARTIVSVRSWNCAARRIVHGTPDSRTARSASAFIRSQATGTRSAPITEM